MIKFYLAKMRLDKFLANKNIGTRKTCKQIINKLRVKVNGAITTKNDMQITSDDIVEVDNKVIENESYVTLLLNKPEGYICSTIDEKYPSVMNLIPKEYQKTLRIVGRLDVDTTGLLLLTDNGVLNARLASPKFNIPKTYKVRVNHLLKKELVDVFLKGNIDIGRNEVVTKAILKIIDDYNCEITIFEGKYHEIKRLFGKFSYDVISLERIKFSFLELDVEKGKYRKLDKNQYKKLLQDVKLNVEDYL